MPGAFLSMNELLHQPTQNCFCVSLNNEDCLLGFSCCYSAAANSYYMHMCIYNIWCLVNHFIWSFKFLNRLKLLQFTCCSRKLFFFFYLLSVLFLPLHNTLWKLVVLTIPLLLCPWRFSLCALSMYKCSYCLSFCLHNI